jgi:hypothetical protein
MHSENKGSGWLLDPNCDLKPYFSDIDDASLAFMPELAGTDARYTIEIDVTNQPITIVDGTITSLIAKYNLEGVLTLPNEANMPLKACLAQPVLSGAGYDAFWTQGNVGLLPAGEIACWYHASVETTSAGFGTEHWGVYLEDDPGFSFR